MVSNTLPHSGTGTSLTNCHTSVASVVRVSSTRCECPILHPFPSMVYQWYGLVRAF